MPRLPALIAIALVAGCGRSGPPPAAEPAVPTPAPAATAPAATAPAVKPADNAAAKPLPSPAAADITGIFERRDAAFVGLKADETLALADGYELRIFLLNKGTKSQGQHGLLVKDGKPLIQDPGRIIPDLKLSDGTMLHHHGHGAARPWDTSGWDLVGERKRPAPELPKKPNAP